MRFASLWLAVVLLFGLGIALYVLPLGFGWFITAVLAVIGRGDHAVVAALAKSSWRELYLQSSVFTA